MDAMVDKRAAEEAGVNGAAETLIRTDEAGIISMVVAYAREIIEEAGRDEA